MAQEKTEKQEKKPKKSQKALIAAHLRAHGRISSWEAIELYHITRLGAFVHLLRKEGWQILTLPKLHKHIKTGNYGTHAEYQLVEAV